MGILFGTDGVRGKANRELTADLAYKLGRAGAHVLTTLGHRPTILVGKDTRLSGDMLEAALIAGILSVGADAAPVGVLPTPAVAFLTKTAGVDAGVMISASHNRFDDNGIKFFSADGYKLSDALEKQIEDIVLRELPLPVPTGDAIGRAAEIPNALESYVRMLVAAADCDLSGMNVVLDCANGASFVAAPEVFERLGANVLSLYDRPSGTNINDGCGSTHIEALQSVIRARGGVGFAFDGDADRMIAVDEAGEVLDGDHVMAICAQMLNREGRLANGTVVGTVMSNLGLEDALSKSGMKLLRTQVGDRYVLEKMLAEGHNFGGEASGHIIFLDISTTGDGILSAIMLAAAMKKSRASLSSLRARMNKYPQLLVNVKVDADKRDFAACAPVMQAIAQAERELGNAGRVLVRASGTEPLIRIMVEGLYMDAVGRCAGNIEKAVRQSLCGPGGL